MRLRLKALLIAIVLILAIAGTATSSGLSDQIQDETLNHLHLSKSFTLAKDGDESFTLTFKYDKGELIWGSITVYGNWDTLKFWKKVTKWR